MICYNKIYNHQISFNGVNYVDVVLAKAVKFVFKRDKDAKYYRIRSNDWVVIRGLNTGVYDALKSRIDDPDSVDYAVNARTNLMDSSGVLIRVYYEGVVNLANCKVNADGETISFIPDANDDYAWYEGNKTIKYDPQVILGTDERVTYEDSPTKRIIFHSTLDPSGYKTGCALQVTAWTTGRQYQITDYDWDDGAALGSETTRGWCKYGGRNFKCKLLHTAAVANRPPPAGNAWWDYITPPPDSYVQQYSELPFDNSQNGNGIYDTGFPSISAIVAGATNCDEGDFYIEKCATVAEEKTLCTRGRALIDLSGGDVGVLNRIIDKTGETFTLVSQFFNDATNPVSSAANKLLNLIICTKEAIINGVDSSNVNDGLSMEDIFKIFRESFNCYWYISGSNLIIEHLSYFEEGLAYGGAPTVGVDLTSGTYPSKYNNTKDPNGENALNVYSFGNFEFPEREVWQWAEQLGNDGYIEYSSLIVEKDKEVTHSMKILTTDIELVVKFPDQVDENGWALMACDGSNVLWTRDTRKLGYIPGQAAQGDLYTDVINGDLYWDHLLTDWFRHGRALETIVVNGGATTALSVRKAKRQEKVRFLRLEDITITDLIRTHMGDAEVDILEVDTESDWVMTTLLYEV